jgi:hypothetical protein
LSITSLRLTTSGRWFAMTVAMRLRLYLPSVPTPWCVLYVITFSVPLPDVLFETVELP